MVMALEDAGVAIEVHHHEVATAGQAEIDMRFDTLLRMADNVMMYKYIVKNVARSNGMTATFMPKPLFGDNGSGMHVPPDPVEGQHQRASTTKPATPGSRDTAKYYIGGLLKHAPALLALAAPTTNSYRRLVPGYRGAGQPGLLAAQPLGHLPHPDVLQEPQGQAHRVPRSRSVLQPVPVLRRPADGRPGRHPEPDRPRRAASTRTCTSCRAEEAKLIKQVPGSLDEVLNALEADHDFLLQGRCLHHGPARSLHRLQARGRGRPGAHAPASVRVHPVLRLLTRAGLTVSSKGVCASRRPFLVAR